MRDDLIPAAQYLRMSTDEQQYSLENQSEKIAEFAALNGFRVQKTFADPGKSGVTIRERSGLKQLLAEVVSGTATFRAILVYDVSRWGRFQDADESAHYEYLCASAGIPIQYCAEKFRNNGAGPSDLLMKALKRAMAAQYSKDLSDKVAAGLRRLASQGFNTGGRTSYGFRRMLLDVNGQPKQTLNIGECKTVLGEKVIVVRGPDEECKVVQRIFKEFVYKHRMPKQIADGLNGDGITYLHGSEWTNIAVLCTLRQLRYTAIQVYGRTSTKLGGTVRRTSRDEWVISKMKMPPIISKEVFAKAQARFENFSCRLTDEQMLNKLRALLRRHGMLTHRIIDHSRSCPAVSYYRKRFGSFQIIREKLGLRPFSGNMHTTNEQRRIA